MHEYYNVTRYAAKINFKCRVRHPDTTIISPCIQLSLYLYKGYIWKSQDFNRKFLPFPQKLIFWCLLIQLSIGKSLFIR